ncbi:hypothetical protein COV61_05350 [Candidatus Micrarchaeota archaeon CG11_big_fil_rev_8_21_14_0_20_47_5]|nr:MAG: hypothetical protein AUJ17_00475 [Candidatus Micrarchaeota archaeon CG1_02_47_40]PIN82661.1 MAG: hypothetical protein COV61_05350 [Candidatus Micrarchaeota archaeon CG11_big_fil_rev_8_21_14_0_20_47_5]
MELLFSIIPFLIGFLAGITGAIFGIGGAVLSIPLFRTLLGMEGHAAIATALPLVFPTAISAGHSYLKQNLLKKKTILLCALAGSIFSIFGAFLTGFFDGGFLMIGVGVILLAIAFMLHRDAKVPLKEECISMNEKAIRTSAIGAVCGFASGFFGIGGGSILVPLLLKIRAIPIKKAIPCSLAIIAIYAIPGSITHYLLGNLKLEIFLPAALGALIGAQIGARINVGMEEERMRKLFALLLILLGVLLIGNELTYFFFTPT